MPSIKRFSRAPASVSGGQSSTSEVTLSGSTLMSPPWTQISTGPVAVKVIGWLAGGVVLLLALRFLAREALPLLVNFDAIFYGRYWPHRGWLLIHMIAGSLALLLGPVQLVANLWWRRIVAHRWIGRTYLSAVVVGALTAGYLAVFNPVGRAAVISFHTLAMVWMISAAMAYLAIRRRQLVMHQEWLLRSYVLGYTVVIFRLLSELPWFVGGGREEELIIGWLSWTVPLFITELVLSRRRLNARDVVTEAHRG